MNNYCCNCRHYDGLFKCGKTCDELDPVYGKRIYAYRVGDRQHGLIPKDVETVRDAHCKGDWFEPSRWARLKEWAGKLFRREDETSYTYVSCYPDELEKLETAEDVVLDIYRRLETCGWESRKAVVLEYNPEGWMAELPGHNHSIAWCKTMDEAARMLWMECRSVWEKKK